MTLIDRSLRRQFTAAMALALALALTLSGTALAHQPDADGGGSDAPRDHFIEHVLIADIARDGNLVSTIPDRRRDCFSDLNQVNARTDLVGSSDVDTADDEFLKDAVCYYARAGVVEGFPDGALRPDADVERDQGASFVARFYYFRQGGLPPPVSHDTDYSDVSFGNAHSGSIWYLSEGGAANLDPPVFQGYTDGTFRRSTKILNRHVQYVEDRLIENFAG